VPLPAANIQISLTLRLIPLPAAPAAVVQEAAAQGIAAVLDEEDDEVEEEEDGEQGGAGLGLERSRAVNKLIGCVRHTVCTVRSCSAHSCPLTNHHARTPQPHQPNPIAAPDATPLALPPALETLVVDSTVNIGVNSLYSLIFGANSAFMSRFWASEDLTSVTVSPWAAPMGTGDKASPPTAAASGDASISGTSSSSGSAPLRVRQVAYVKPLRIPIPLAPKQCNVWEEHRLLAKSDGGWVVECKSTNDAPKGDCFYVLVQLCGVRRNSRQAQLRISMTMVFYRSCLGRGMISYGAESDARRGWEALVRALQKHSATASGRPLTAALQAPAGTPAAADAAGAPTAVPSSALVAQPGVPGAADKPRLPARLSRWCWQLLGSPSPETVLLAGCLFALVVLVLVVMRAAAEISSELHQLAGAVHEAAGSCPSSEAAASVISRIG